MLRPYELIFAAIMTSNPVDWTEDVAPDPELEYRALLRSLRRTRGFGLFFVQCSPAEGERLMQKVRSDMPQKTIDVLKLERAISNLYDEVAALPNKDDIEILFIQGLELSLYEYEQDKLWTDSAERYNYSEGSIPKLLAHLNLSRERFRNHFNICFVFLVPLFALKYLMRRAPDFFDWRSGVLEFAMDAERLEQESQRLTLDSDYKQYLTWTPQQHSARIIEIQALLEEPQQIPKRKLELLHQQGNLFFVCQNYLAIVASSDQAVAIKPDYDAAWYNRGIALSNLGRKEEAIASYDQAVAIKPDYHQAWSNRGKALSALGRTAEAIISYEKAIAINPNYHQAWGNRGNALYDLGRNEDAIASYDQAIAIKSDYYQAWYNKACCYALWSRVETAIENLQQAIELNPKYREKAKTDADFDGIRQDERFRALVGE